MKLKSGLRALWRSGKEAQVGCDPGLAVTLRLEHPREFDVLLMLEEDQTPARLRRELERLGGRAERADALVRELADGGLLEAGSRNASAELRVEPERRDLVAAEAESRALAGGDGWRALARRQDQCVSVYGLGRTGAHVALGLAAAGVGRLQLRDRRPVAARDRGQVFGREHVGVNRAEAVAAVIRERELGCVARVGGRWREPAAAVLVDYEVSDPNRSAFLAARRVPHLSVVVGELSITCGPWVPSRGGPCLRCWRLWEAERDSGWPGLATQRFARSAVAARGEDPCLASWAGALAVGQVLGGLGGAAPAAGRMVTMGLPSYGLDWRDLDPHPKCDHGASRKPGRRPAAPPPPVVPQPPLP
jgi:hypothetical protein